jgi:hypothetical protein
VLLYVNLRGILAPGYAGSNMSNRSAGDRVAQTFVGRSI